MNNLTAVEELQAIIVECCGDAPSEEKAREYLRSLVEKMLREPLSELIAREKLEDDWHAALGRLDY